MKLGKGDFAVVGVLSESGRRWLGVDELDGDPELKIPDHLLKKARTKYRKSFMLNPDFTELSAATLNDYCNFSFEEIADCFEFTYLS